MMLVTNLSHIEQYAQQHAGEFQEFLKRVKQVSVVQFDSMASPIISEVTADIDCTQCGNCCKHQEPGITDDEQRTLAAIKSIPVEEFNNKFVATDPNGVTFLCNKPCIFLHQTQCSIYSSRPASCADYPGLHRPGLKWRMKQVEYNYSICPIVFNVVEQLKTLL